MVRRVRRKWINRIVLLAGMAGLAVNSSAADVKPMKDSAGETGPRAAERITFGGGCFWCLEAVFERLKGVTQIVSGYAGGSVPNPSYEAVCSGDTGHAEVVQLTFDPARIRYEQLLAVFWAAHDPTSVLEEEVVRQGKRYPKGTPYQGADVGTQYRSIILYETPAQKEAAEKSLKAAQKDFRRPIATSIVPLQTFHPAEDYHQGYYDRNRDRNPYCSAVITPKLQKLLRKGLITEEPERR
jgi:peptide-methionine (S)-S-oxide reductase